MAGLYDGAVWLCFLTVIFLCLEVLGERAVAYFSCRKGRTDRSSQNVPPDLLHKFLSISTLQVVLTGGALKFYLKFLLFHHFLSSPNYCNVKIKSLGSHLKPQILQNHGKEN